MADNLLIKSLEPNLPFVSELLQADIRLFVKKDDNQIYFYDYYKPNQDSLYMDLNESGPKKNHVLESHKDLIVHKAFEMGKAVIGQYGLVIKNRPIQEFAYPIKDSDNTVAVIAIERDIYLTRSTLGRYWNIIADNLIKALQEKIRNKQTLPIIDLGEGALILDENRNIIFANTLAISLVSELVEHPKQLLNKSLDELFLNCTKTYKGSQKEHSIEAINEISLKQRTLNIRHITLNESISVVLIKDFSEIKIKETLLREIHHRVKNNLQTVASLLRMQKRRNPELRSAFREAMNRVQSISLVHEYLATSDNVELIDFGFLANKLIKELLSSFGADENLQLSFNCPEKIYLNSDKATNLALVINELLTNSLEHGGDNVSKINIELNLKNKNLEINIEDNGIGFPEDFDYRKSSGLGWQIIRTLVEDSLSGSINIETPVNSGTKLKLNLPYA